MCTNTDDVDDEYLDDPISLVPIEDIKTEICEDEVQIIEVSSDEEETCTSAYGKKDFVLPVTFFDISKNVKLLSKCKPLSIRIVDCKQYPTYYTKYQEKCRNNYDESVEVDSKCKSDTESNPCNVSVEDTVIIISTKEKADKTQEREKKRRIHRSDSFYQKLKKRKEERKQVALKCKDLSQIDFKKNKGLVGLKITDTIFKQIVDSEKALISNKSYSVENKSSENNPQKSENPSIAVKTITPNSICKDKCDSVAEKALTMSKSVSVEKNSKENNNKYLNESEKMLLLTTKTNTTDDKFSERVPESLSIKKVAYTGNKYYDKKECDKDKDKANIETKSVYTDKNVCKEKSDGIAEKDSIKTKIKSVEIKRKEKITTDAERALIESHCNSTTATVATLEKSKKQEFESFKYIKKVGDVLDNLGTSMIPLTANYTDYCVPKHVGPQDNSELNSIEASISQTDNFDTNKVGSQIRCSLKILSNNVIKKVLKLKKAKLDPKNVANTVFQHNPNELQSKVDQIATNSNLNQSKHNIERVCVSSDKDKMQIKRTASNEVEKHSDGTKRVEKAVVKDASSDQAGPNSPVIPCTTISVRAATPKLTETKSTPSVQKQSGFPNVSTTNKTDVTNSKCTAISKHNKPIVPNAIIKSITPLTSRTLSKFSGHNAIILRKSRSIPSPSPSRQLLNYPPPNQGLPIQTLVNNRFHYQPIPRGPRPMRFHHPPPCPPLPSPLTPPNNANLTQVTPQRFIPPYRLLPTYLRGIEMGLHHWRFPPFPPVNRPPLSVPRPPCPQVNKDSLIGNTANGDPIQKINIPVVPNTLDDKQKMLAELNTAILSRELTNNQDNDLKRKADNIPIDSVTPKHSKPGPLSKKITTDEYEVKIPDKLSPNNGYSPPILPIFPYQESFKIFSPNDSKKPGLTSDGQNRTPLKCTKSTGSIRKLDKDHKRLSQQESGKDKAKKISYADYRKRVIKGVVDRIDVSKMRKYDAKNIADDNNQDQGYDSDSTVKL